VSARKPEGDWEEYERWCVDRLLGVPVRTSKEERAKARRFSLRQQKEREALEAAIAELEKSGVEVTEEVLEDFGLWVPPVPPAWQFIQERLKGVPPEGCDSAFRQALADLHARGIPQDKFTRGFITAELHRNALPEKQQNQYDRDAKLRAEITTIKAVKRHLVEGKGLTPSEADDAIVKSLGLRSVGALDKMLYRARRRGIS
jgi:hypothetical protein